MNPNLTDVTMVLDRSWSMNKCRGQAEEGCNSFINEQKRAEGECLFTMLEFNDEPKYLCQGVPIGTVEEYRLFPDGNTALWDAIGTAIDDTGKRLAAMPEATRPGLVVVAIVSDGENNRSRIFTESQVRSKIQHQQQKYGWKFNFVGANQDSFLVADKLAIPQDAVANFMPQNAAFAFQATSGSVKRMRSASAQGIPVSANYTDDERRQMAGAAQPDPMGQMGRTRVSAAAPAAKQ